MRDLPGPRRWRTGDLGEHHFDYQPEIRKVIYSTNAIGSTNAQFRKVTKKRGAFFWTRSGAENALPRHPEGE